MNELKSVVYMSAGREDYKNKNLMGITFTRLTLLSPFSFPSLFLSFPFFFVDNDSTSFGLFYLYVLLASVRCIAYYGALFAGELLSLIYFCTGSCPPPQTNILHYTVSTCPLVLA